MATFTLNGKQVSVDVDASTPLLWVLRDTIGMTGTKFGCGVAACGACTVHVDGAPKVACLIPMGTLSGRRITTIEGLGAPDMLNAVQQAFVDHDVVQCGMCFPGMVLSMSHFLAETPHPTRDEIKRAMTGNLCRCTGYERIVDALASIAPAQEALS